MYTLNVEMRDLNTKSKNIRKNGMVPCIISNGKTNETILIQIPDGEVKKLLRSKGRGGKIVLNCDGASYNVMMKEIISMHSSNQIEHITFVLLNEDEYVNSFARVILKNKDKIQSLIYQPVKEIPYKALSQHLVEEVEIDLATLKPGAKLMLTDLSIWDDKNLKILMKDDSTILSIS